jgi:hypothetical protein
MVMTTKGLLEVQIGNLKLMEQQLKEKLKEYVNNISEPLEDRWKLFVEAKLGDHKSYYAEFAGIDSDDYYDKYYIEKYQTVFVTELFEHDQELDKPNLDTPEKVTQFKEDVLKKFIYSFRYDW